MDREKYRIGVVTATRAEYGLLKNVMKKIEESNALELVLFVTGTHLFYEYGHTIDEIVEDGFEISETIDIMMRSDTPSGICKAMGMASILFGEAFERQKLDFLVVLGDRFELMPICQAAMCERIPIAHISGGETTEGAIDEAVRHCVTKMSYLHFPSCEEYRKRIIQLGESPDRVFNFGDVGVENILSMPLLPRKELEKSLCCSLEKPYFCVTFHPVTLENSSGDQIDELLLALDCYSDYTFIFSKANADAGNQIINQRIEEYVNNHNNCYLFDSVGVNRFLSLLKWSRGIIGNSSSGMIEAPALGIPTINIGDRQRGRIKAKSVIDCLPLHDDIVQAIARGLSEEFKKTIQTGACMFAGNNVSGKIVSQIQTELEQGPIEIKKKFYDIEYEI